MTTSNIAQKSKKSSPSHNNSGTITPYPTASLDDAHPKIWKSDETFEYNGILCLIKPGLNIVEVEDGDGKEE